MTSLHLIDGKWVEGNPPLLGPMANAFWMASVAFDGARAFAGVAPDLDRHAARLVRSAKLLGLEPTLSAEEIAARAWDGIGKFAPSAELYIRPLFYAEEGFVIPKPESAKFVLTIFDAPLPEPKGFTATLSDTRRPTPESAPTLAKASALYPQNAEAMRRARAKGFSNAVVLDAAGNVAEFATANLFIAKDGQVHTPAPNGCFLDGITRQRVIALLRGSGIEVIERALSYKDLLEADEIFSTGNYAKVTPLIQFEDRPLPAGPFYQKARALYFDWAKGSR
ncbi:MAG: branched-chain amino acid aminotransferase [Alphaproteobacteria bacterium]